MNQTHASAPHPYAQPPRILFVGGSGHHYLRELLKRGATGAMVSDPLDEQASHDLARELGLDEIGGNLAAAVGEVNPDVVSVGTIYARNGDYVLQALRAGTPVVTDKPLAATWQRLAEIEEALRASDAPVVVTEFDWRWRASLRAARRAVAQGRIGPVVLAVAQKSYKFGERPKWYGDRSLYGGTMLWVASHGIDAVKYVTEAAHPQAADQTLRVLAARQGNVARPSYGTLEDHTVTLLVLPTGGTGVVHADLLNPAGSEGHGQDRLRVVGGRGELLVENGRCWLTTDDAAREDITAQGEPETALADELLRAASGGESEAYGTAASLATARLLLEARDAADGLARQEVVNVADVEALRPECGTLG